MKGNRFSIRWLALLVPACTVDTPVIEGDKATFDDRLGADLGAWCEANCENFMGCTQPPGRSDGCADECYALFTTEFVGKGDACETGALRLMDCAERSSCEDGVCDTQLEIQRCVAANAQVDCQSRSGVGGGSTSGVVPPPQPSCDVGYEIGYDDCSNDRTYTVSCSESLPRECQCMVDDYVTGRFRYDISPCPPPFEARRICGWPIVPMPDEAPIPGPVSCVLGTSEGLPGGGPDGCEIFFEGCSDGANYGITCDGSTDASCRCSRDGELSFSFATSEHVCPYTLEPDNGAAVLNYVCHFSIMSAIPER